MAIVARIRMLIATLTGKLIVTKQRPTCVNRRGTAEDGILLQDAGLAAPANGGAASNYESRDLRTSRQERDIRDGRPSEGWQPSRDGSGPRDGHGHSEGSDAVLKTVEGLLCLVSDSS